MEKGLSELAYALFDPRVVVELFFEGLYKKTIIEYLAILGGIWVAQDCLVLHVLQMVVSFVLWILIQSIDALEVAVDVLGVGRKIVKAFLAKFKHDLLISDQRGLRGFFFLL